MIKTGALSIFGIRDIVLFSPPSAGNGAQKVTRSPFGIRHVDDFGRLRSFLRLAVESTAGPFERGKRPSGRFDLKPMKNRRTNHEPIDHDYEFTIKASGANYSLNRTVLVRVLNTDVAEIELEPTSLDFVETIEPSVNHYEVELAGHPSDDVTVTLVSDNAYVEVDTDPVADGAQNTIVFTPRDFNHEHTVIVTVYPDHDGDNATATITHTASGGGYVDVTNTVTVNVSDLFECPPER